MGSRFRVVALRKLIVAFGIAMATSCGSDAVAPADEEPDIATMRLSSAGQLITVTQTGAVSGGPGVLRAGVPAAVSAVFLTVNGELDPRLTPAHYQVNVSVVPGPSSGSISFQRSNTDPFAGTITAVQPNVQVVLRFSLYNVDKQHDLWGPFEVPFTVSN